MLRAAFAWYTAICWLTLTAPSFVLAQDYLHFTSGVSNPSPQPGQPFTITWAGGDSTGTVYIVLQYLFPDTPNQDIYYSSTDILSNAPNNGSWVYNVPDGIFPGRYAFSIGINPFLLSDSTPSFTIVNDHPSSIASQSAPVTTASSNYNGCGLPPLPDYTYTGYQPPCTITTDGHVQTIYPIVPASLSDAFFGPKGIDKTNSELGSVATPPGFGSGVTSTSTISSVSTTAFATDVYAQALQCPSAITPIPATIAQSGAMTVFTTVGCSAASSSNENIGQGVCHTSGYTTFSVSGTKSVCCPMSWQTTPLASGLYCFTSASELSKRSWPWERHVAVAVPRDQAESAVTLTGLVFTTAGVVKNAATPASSSGSAAQTSSAKNVGTRREHCTLWQVVLIGFVAAMQYGFV